MDLELRIVELLEQNNTLLTSISRGFEDGEYFPSESSPRTQAGSRFPSFGVDAVKQFGDTLNNSSGDVSKAFRDLQNNASLNVGVGKELFNALGKMSSGMVNFTAESFEAQQALKKFGVDLGGDILEFQSIAAALNMDVRDTQRFIADNATLFARMGPSVTEAVQQFRTFRSMMDDTNVEDALRSLGLQFQDLNEYTANYLAMRGIQDLSDQAEMRRRMTDMVLFRQAIQDFADLTGQSAEEVDADARAMFESEAGLRLRMRYGDATATEVATMVSAMGLDAIKGFALEDNFAVAAAMDNDSAVLATAQELNRVANTMKQMGLTFEEAKSMGLLTNLAKVMTRETQQYANFAGAPMTSPGQAMGRIMGNTAFQNIVTNPDAIEAIDRTSAETAELKEGLATAQSTTDFQAAMKGVAEDLAGGADSAVQKFLTLENSIAEISSSLRNKVAALEDDFEQGFNDALGLISNEAFKFSQVVSTNLEPDETVKQENEQQRIENEINRLTQRLEAGTITEDEKKLLQELKEAVVNTGKPNTDSVNVNVIKFLGSEKLPDTAEGLGGVVSPGAEQTVNDLFGPAEQLLRQFWPWPNRQQNTIPTNDLEPVERKRGSFRRKEQEVQNEVVSRQTAKENETNDYLKSLGYSVDTLGDTFEGIMPKLETMIQAMRDLSVTYEKGADKQANATFSGALHMAEQAATATLGERVNATVGPIHRGPQR